MNNGKNNARRSRNIGTAKQGHGQNNKLKIPTHLNSDKVYFEDLKNYRCVERVIQNYPINFLIEETRDNVVHACTVDDIERVLQNVPAADLAELHLIILRQPKRKEEILNPVWGRYIFYAVIDEFSGAAICFDAVDLTKPFHQTKSLTPDEQFELERLKTDGHLVEATKRHYIISSDLIAVRSTQLYRTLLHELGHHVDFQRDYEAFDLKTSKDKEVFAHRYADELRAILTQNNILPFERIFDAVNIQTDGLRLTDFASKNLSPTAN